MNVYVVGGAFLLVGIVLYTVQAEEGQWNVADALKYAILTGGIAFSAAWAMAGGSDDVEESVTAAAGVVPEAAATLSKVFVEGLAGAQEIFTGMPSF
jgi:hypothetical protein